MGHWFDGDGAILGVHFTDAGANAVYRYVQTAGYKEEAAADKLLYGNYGMTAPGPIWNQWFKPMCDSPELPRYLESCLVNSQSNLAIDY